MLVIVLSSCKNTGGSDSGISLKLDGKTFTLKNGTETSSVTLEAEQMVQINLEDDVRSFLIARLTGNQLTREKKAELRSMGIDVRRLCKPSYIMVHSGSDAPPDIDPERCHIGAEGVMVHEDEEVVHLAFKCGDPEHEMHYTTYEPMTVIQLALGMEATWPGSVLGPLFEQAVKMGRAEEADSEAMQAFRIAFAEEVDSDLDGEDSELDLDDPDLDDDEEDLKFLDELEDDEDDDLY